TDGQGVKADEVDPAPGHLHPYEQGDHRHHCRRDEPAYERRGRVAEDDPAAVRRREEEPPPEAALEIPRDAEAREDPAERRGLEKHEHELEGRIPRRVVEPRHLVDAREAACERREEEQREDERRDEERRVREDVVEHTPGHSLGDGQRPHERVSLVRSDTEASVTVTISMRLAPP